MSKRTVTIFDSTLVAEISHRKGMEYAISRSFDIGPNEKATLVMTAPVEAKHRVRFLAVRSIPEKNADDCSDISGLRFVLRSNVPGYEAAVDDTNLNNVWYLGGKKSKQPDGTITLHNRYVEVNEISVPGRYNLIVMWDETGNEYLLDTAHPTMVDMTLEKEYY